MTEAALHNDDMFLDIDPVSELMALFERHDLLPEDSDHDHVYAASLAMLVTALHWHGDDRHFFEALPYTIGRDMDLTDLLNAMANLGFTSHKVTINLDQVDTRLMPCMFIPDGKKHLPVILHEIEEDGSILVFDSKEQKNNHIPKGTSFPGVVYFFEKIDPEEIESENNIKAKAGYSWFRGIFERFNPLLKQIFFTSIMINIFALAMPIFIMTVYDKVIGANSMQTLHYLLAGVLLAITAETILRFMRSKTVCWLGVRLDNIVSNAIFERLLLMPASYTESASISSQMARLKAFESVRDFFTGSLFLVMIELPFMLVLLAAIWVIAGPLVLIPIVVAGLYAITLWFFHRKLKVAIRASAKSGAAKQQFGMETFIKMRALRYNGIAGKWWETYKELTGRSSVNAFRSNFIASIIETIAHGLSVLAGVSVIAFGVNQIWAGDMTIGALVATMIIIWRILAPLQTICSMLPRIEQLKNSIAQVNRMMNIEVERTPHVLKKPINSLEGRIKFSNVGLRYSKDVEPIFVGLNLDIKAGEVVAITGGNGSGKTTILKLVNGLYSPQAGNIRIDGIDIRQLEPIELRHYISYLPQSPDFFEGTIRDNLRLANPLCTDDDIYKVLEKVNALENFESLENGLDTKISGNDSTLSSGLAYRLNMARVLLKDSNILLLDELPNASLNSSTGETYKNLIQTSKGLRTTFFVTHRDDYLQMADKVIVLQAGKKPQVLEPSEVINKYGEF